MALIRLILPILLLSMMASYIVPGVFATNPVCGPNIKFLPHENCRKFYQCNMGRATELNCPLELYFNAKLNLCDWPANNPRPECRQ
ncbi:endochitinase-like [Episyrphus balteatus]|uniref:endochitinase-like n=1 Tax=Episyrphus balteatus TaxID=286459 RepID=UPI002485C863|nr:endochitinase-like [Episyrphus balteatus]